MKNIILTRMGTIIFVAFTTLSAQAQIKVKWEEIFATTTPPSGWLVINNDNSPDNQQGATSWRFVQQVTLPPPPAGNVVVPQAGLSFWHSGFNNANAKGLIDEWLITPRISQIARGDTLIFYAGGPDKTYKDSLRVFVSTTDNQLASFKTQIGYFKVNQGGWNQYKFDLSLFSGSNVYIAVNYFIVNGGSTGNNSDNVWVDHFIITGLTTFVNENAPIVNQFELFQNYPNPFNPSTSISFKLSEFTQVTLKVYSDLGQEVATILNSIKLPPGQHAFKFDATQLAGGTYYYILKAGKDVSTKKMIMLK